MTDAPDLDKPHATESPTDAAPPESTPAGDDPSDLDLDQRQLCDDGSCTGIIGDDGACRLCGRAAGPPELSRPAATISDDDLASIASPESDASTTESFDEERKLCPDGACVGLIGDDGKCRVCGSSAE